MKVILRAFLALAIVLSVGTAKAELTPVVDYNSVITEPTKFQEKELMCLARNIYYESGSESLEGKIAVAMVTINRAESGNFPNTLCGVVNQKTRISPEVVVCQFSWVCQGRSLKTAIGERWEEALQVARLVLFEGWRIPKLEDAMYFHAAHVNPRWGLPKVAKIGNHVFYKSRAPKLQSF